MHPLYVILSTTLLLTGTTSAPARSKLQLLRDKNGQLDSFAKEKSQRRTRSFLDWDVDIELWTETPLVVAHPQIPKTLTFNIEKNGHVTPDFSNGLDYPDPLLLTGLAAKRAVSYLYSKELFFGDIPHVRLVLQNQRHRSANGLSGNRLGSLRDQSPFFRFKNSGFT
ncbi:hypothetical protein NQ318_020720 [Aromia moschata]|uniref:Uncharacterized protein n=1 Tax=Aromia moschata TaxID=1265417 RepID=A0AAV8YWV3_9CUCU|nr:hypothetical protein NQ318_020720 [Aromia moschata]